MFSATGELEMIPGGFSSTGPQCLLKLGDGARAGRCLDVESTKTLPGGLMNVYPCKSATNGNLSLFSSMSLTDT